MARSDYSFFHPFRVRYAEIDAQGIVFNSHYLIYIDTAVYEYFRALPFDFGEYIARTGKDFHTVHIGLDFISQTTFDERVEVGVRTSKIGNSSLSFEVEIFGRLQDEARVRGGLVWVHADPKTKKSMPLPGELIDLIRDLEGSTGG